MSDTSFAKVYWCARDLDGSSITGDLNYATPGNHHFVLVVYQDEAAAKKIHQGCELAYEEESTNVSTVYFSTLAGFEGDEGKIQLGVNHTEDVQAVREWIDPDEHTSWYESDYDLEKHHMDEGCRNKTFDKDTLSEEQLVRLLVKAAHTYAASEGVDYDLHDRNCASWVNTLFKAVGYPKPYRDSKGEFSGVDWGEEDLLDDSLFIAD